MPTFIQEVPELDACVRRPVIAKVIDDLFAQTNIDPNEVRVYQMGRSAVIPQLNSTIDKTENAERLNTETRVEVTMSEEITNTVNAPVLYPNAISVFRDAALNVSVVPTIVSTKTSINIRFVGGSRAEALNWRQAINRQVSQRVFNPIHTVNFYYPIPQEFMYALSKIHELRENVAGYNESFGDWLKANFINRFSVVTDSAGRNTQFVIREQQTNIIGYYDFGEDVVEVEKENDAGSYAAEFTYTFFHERPDNIVLTYPIVIHNQIVPAQIRDDRQVEDAHPTNYYLDNSSKAFESFAFGVNKQPRHPRFSGFPVPYFDEWYPSYRQRYYQNLLRVTCQVSPNDVRWVTNIPDVNPYEISADIIEYMKRRPQAMTRHRDHLFHISLHRWDELFASDELQVDENLKVTAPVDMDLRDMWHFNIDILNDLSMLSEEGLDDLCKSPDVLDKWKELFDTPDDLDDLIKNPDGSYRPGDVLDKIDESNNQNDFINGSKAPGIKTVGLYRIIARKEK